MALFPLCRTPSDFLHGRRAAVTERSSHPIFQVLGVNKGGQMAGKEAVRPAGGKQAVETPWGAPLVWGDASNSEWRRAQFAKEEIRTGLLVLVVGTYAQHVRRFLWSAEANFLPGRTVTYYVLTDNPRSLDPPVQLGPGRALQVVPIAELPGWERLAQRRMTLLAEAIRDPIRTEVDYVFCADVDQEFVAPVGEEILGELVATLHPELYGMPRNTFPYENDESSSACVDEDEGDYYYTSELYGGSVAEMHSLTRACSILILQDHANGVSARGLEESYLNRYLVNHRPTCVLSPEYSWWESALSADVPVQRLVSLGRQCEALDEKKKLQHRC
ncbi:globoside alpha-1,3-N-acetylgalactosaminyltransferase 1-like isoform X2 [Genypterus blacodes]|uniref:globoside alpha-1,3-N-acetylgalactosaminyltransferase 1-like isoform X2 n=1 Tax=Genypterus blacodes TaxID=154954 RepID=UPI003F7645F6